MDHWEVDFTHWAREELPHLIEPKPYRVPTLRPDHKPHGFWLSIDKGWENWCKSDAPYFLEECQQYRISVSKDVNILWLTSMEEMIQFTQSFMTVADKNTMLQRGQRLGYDYTDSLIRWHRVMELYDGIGIMPYNWQARGKFAWYYSWDCASACLWRWKPGQMKATCIEESCSSQ